MGSIQIESKTDTEMDTEMDTKIDTKIETEIDTKPKYVDNDHNTDDEDLLVSNINTKLNVDPEIDPETKTDSPNPIIENQFKALRNLFEFSQCPFVGRFC